MVLLRQFLSPDIELIADIFFIIGWNISLGITASEYILFRNIWKYELAFSLSLYLVLCNIIYQLLLSIELHTNSYFNLFYKIYIY